MQKVTHLKLYTCFPPELKSSRGPGIAYTTSLLNESHSKSPPLMGMETKRTYLHMKGNCNRVHLFFDRAKQ